MNTKYIIILLDTNILINAIKENWHIHSLIENQIYQYHKIIVPNLIVKELKKLKIKKTVKNGALRLVNDIFELLDDTKFLSERIYELPVDDQLLQLAIELNMNNKVVIMTQDNKFKEKILDKGLNVLIVSYGTSKLITI